MHLKTTEIIWFHLEQKVKLGQYDMLDNEIPTLSEFSERYIEHQRDVIQKRSWKIDADILKRWNAVFGDRKLSEIVPKDIDDYKQTRLNTFREIVIKNKDGSQTAKVKFIKPATVNRELEVLKHLFNLARRWKKFFGENPVSESGLLKVNNLQERILSLEEENRLIMNSSPNLVPILITALNTGMRKGEIISLRWEDIDFENNLITVRQEVSKSKKSRRIPINSALRKTLVEQKLKTGQTNYVFLSPALSPKGEPQPYQRRDSLKRCFEGACRRANIEGLRFHDLRHTFATRTIELGASIVAVSRILGHADIKTTMRYAHPDNSLKEAVESLAMNFPLKNKEQVLLCCGDRNKVASLRYKMIRSNHTLRRLRHSIAIILAAKRGKRKAGT